VIIPAPFNREQVESLNAFQYHAFRRPDGPFPLYLCPRREGPGHRETADRGILMATNLGWTCVDCGFAQDWAYDWNADWSWKNRTF
jgi:hypothetical protein